MATTAVAVYKTRIMGPVKTLYAQRSSSYLPYM